MNSLKRFTLLAVCFVMLIGLPFQSSESKPRNEQIAIQPKTDYRWDWVAISMRGGLITRIGNRELPVPLQLDGFEPVQKLALLENRQDSLEFGLYFPEKDEAPIKARLTKMPNWVPLKKGTYQGVPEKSHFSYSRVETGWLFGSRVRLKTGNVSYTWGANPAPSAKERAQVFPPKFQEMSALYIALFSSSSPVRNQSRNVYLIVSYHSH